MCFEFIFGDFVSKNIDNNKCFIKYNGKDYNDYDDKNFLSLRCLNLINVDVNLMKFPVGCQNEIISAKIFDDSSFLIFISVAEQIPKTFGIFLNKHFVENTKKITAKEVCDTLNPSLNIIKNILNYNENKS